LFLITTAIAVVFASTSCTKTLDLDKTLKFSTLTVEQQKQKIEDNAISFVDKMDAVKDTKAMNALLQFTQNSNSSSSYVAPFKVLRSNLLRNNTKSLEVFDKQMRVASSVGDSIWGEWTWNATKNDFIKTKNYNNKAVYLFPADSLSNTNNAELTINYVESTVAAPNTDPVEYMPSTISVVLKVNGTTAMTAEFTGQYKADGTPTSAKQTLVIDKYSWSAELSNTTSDLSAKYSFKCNTETLIKMELSASGNLTATEIDASQGPQDVFTSGAMSFQVMNIAFLGGFKDFKGFANEMNSITNTNDRAYADKQVAAINKYLKLYGYFVDKNQKFADVEFYVVESTTQEYDYSTYPYQLVSKTSYDYQPRFVLSDGSKVDIQTYVQTGFEDLITKLESYQK
jgi:hypothetical protein